GLLGALIGSFANVVIWRLPRRESIVFPGSHCPRCGRALGALDLVPVVSWLALGGRCRYCRAAIAFRYPLVELVMALGFTALVWRFPVGLYGLSVLPLLVLYAMLVMMAAIDLDQQILPDSLTLPAVAVGLAATLLYDLRSGLPGFTGALFGGALGAGLLVLVNRLGSLALRRFADTKERLWPIGMDQVNLAALGGALYGWPLGLAMAGLSVLVNLAAKKSLRLPEGPLYSLWLAALIAASLGLTIDFVHALSGTLVAAGAVAILGAGYWWLRDLRTGQEVRIDLAEEDDDPVAMGFGDVKLAAALGVMLGWQSLLLALLLSFFLGALGGVAARALGGGRQVPFGPYLAAGGLIALFFGPALIAWYLGLLGLA
ncbi:MAG: prepilin peptidase, partial [Deinococcota bacterium]|nr:prepilin peptidase [Deinococcota bacterium]